MGLGITIPVTLAAEKALMKPAISDALVIFWDSMSAAAGTSAQTTKKQYADEFARILADTMFDRIVTYVATNALVTGNVIPTGGPLLAGSIT